MINNINKAMIVLALSVITCTVFAQKSNEVFSNFRIKKEVKIDGILKEWKDSLNAYNANTKLYYTIANDNDNLYLAIRSADKAMINKILVNGLSFTISETGKKKLEDVPTVTFPIIERSAFRKLGAKKLVPQSKEIRVASFRDLVDGGISIYNDFGIRVAAAYDEKENFTYELSIPLQQLGFTINKSDPIAYNIKINGLPVPANLPPPISNGFGMYGSANRSSLGSNTMFQSIDFWVRYTLAK